MVHYPSLRELKRTLGAEYRIRTIDWEKCLYRDLQPHSISGSGNTHTTA